MSIYDKIITLAQKYCDDNYRYWVEKYQKERTGNDYPYTYTENDYNLFPRYIKLGLISKGVDLLVDQQFKSFEDCVQSLLNAADFQGNSTTQLSNEVGKFASEDEKLKYQKYILNFSESNLLTTLVEHSIYRKKLDEQEAKKIREKLLEKWNYSGSYWYPLIDTPLVSVLFLMDEYVLPFEKNIIDIVKSISLCKFYAIDEIGDDYKYSLNTFNLSSLYETMCCDDTFEWVIYRSHEGTIAFGGEKLISQVKEILKHCKNKFNVLEFD